MSLITAGATDAERLERLELQLRDLPTAGRVLDAHDEARRKIRGEQLAKMQEASELRQMRDELVDIIERTKREFDRPGIVASEADEARLARDEAWLAKVKAAIKALTARAPKPPKLSVEERKLAEITDLFAPKYEEWGINIRGNARFEEFVPEVKVTKAELKALRARKAAIIAEAVEVQTAPLDFASIDARIDADVDALALKGKPEVSGACRMMTMVGGKTAQGHVNFGSISADGDTFLAVWAVSDEIKAKLKAAARERVGDRVGISAEDKARRVAELRAEHLELDRAEVAICRELGEEHGRIHPMAWLGIRRIADAPRPQREPMSWDMPAGTPVTIGVPLTALMPTKGGE
jgi:hypothetical protein